MRDIGLPQFCAALLLILPSNSFGQATTLHNFGSGATDGQQPYAAVILGSDGNFYGTTQYGGTSGGGTVFKMIPAGTLNVLHSFSAYSVATDGTSPQFNPLIQGSDGNFYGTTPAGGATGTGTVYRITPGGTLTVLHNFGDGGVANDGAGPAGGLVQDATGNLIGTTVGGGSNGTGSIFKISMTGALSILHSFGAGSPAIDGVQPYGALVLAKDGNYYGTSYGGGAKGVGAVFRTTPSGVVTLLHSFTDGSVAADGQSPYAGLIQGNDGYLYGTTSGGGSAGQGTIFKLSTQGVLTILHAFSDGSTVGDGVAPYAALFQGSDGNLYGTTIGGGSAGAGTAFRLSTAGAGYTLLYAFATSTNDGTSPMSAFISGGDGFLYSTASGGGTSGAGVVFKVAGPAATTATGTGGGNTTPTIASVTLSPASVVGGGHSVATVSLTAAAPSSGATVSTKSSQTAIATIPATVSIAGGAISATQSIATLPVNSLQTSTITATLNASTASAVLSVESKARLLIKWVNGNSIEGGSTGLGSVAILNVAPAGGVTVSLSSDSPDVIVPRSIKIPAGGRTANFVATARPVTISTGALISASALGAQAYIRVTDLAPPQPNPPTVIVPVHSGGGVPKIPITNPIPNQSLINMTVAWSPNGGNYDVPVVTVILSSPAPAGGIGVSLSSDQPASVLVLNSPTILIGAGKTSGYGWGGLPAGTPYGYGEKPSTWVGQTATFTATLGTVTLQGTIVLQ